MALKSTPLLTVATALDLISKTAVKFSMSEEMITIKSASNRIAATAMTAQTTLPPLDASAMDGYAIIATNDEGIGSTFTLIGQSPAGAPFEGKLGPNQCVRIFTGGAVPYGATHVIMQENIKANGDQITLSEPVSKSTNIRKAGIDFKHGQTIIETGQKLDAYGCALIAAAGHATVGVYKKPIIALIANGDELVEPGAALSQSSIISSNPYGLAPLIEQWGGEVIYAGISKDDPEAIKTQIKTCERADILLPIGGASVGDRDFMRPVFDALGYTPVFTRVAVKPGKPTWFGHLPDQLVLGLPGNPASALVCAHVFLKPLIFALLNRMQNPHRLSKARLSQSLSKNSWRQDHLRAQSKINDKGEQIVTPYPRQDSSLIIPFLTQNCLIVRPPEEAAKQIGDLVDILTL